MFGGGTLAVVTGIGALARTTERRDELIATLGLVAPGNGLVFVEAARTGSKGAIAEEAGRRAWSRRAAQVSRFVTPKAGSLTGWIEHEAREQGVDLGPGAAKEIAVSASAHS